MRQHGFTLMEVLVALLILTLSLGALIKAAGSFTSNSAHLRDRAYAQWVAANQLTTFQLDASWPRLGTQNGTMKMGGHSWYWQAKVQKVADKDLRQIDITVRRESTDPKPIFTLNGFLGNPKLIAPAKQQNAS